MSELKHHLMLNKDMSWVPCYIKSDVDKMIADLEESHKKEVEQLLMEIVKLKERVSEERSAKVDYKISANDLSDGLREALDENHRLKRALWLARASMCRNYDIRSYFIDRIDSKRQFAEFAILMQKAAATAEIKAKEYK